MPNVNELFVFLLALDLWHFLSGFKNSDNSTTVLSRSVRSTLLLRVLIGYNGSSRRSARSRVSHGIVSSLHVFPRPDLCGARSLDPHRISVAGKREGVLYLRERNLDVFFITLNKSEKHFSPSTMYNDYAISERLFHWQSQSTTSGSSPTGQRYIHHGSKVLLFVREFNKVGNVSQPFVCLGTARYVSHEGSKPMSIVWRLDAEIPAWFMRKAGKGI